MNSGMISRYSSYHWIHTWIHYYEFIHDFIIMNSTAWIHIWIHTYEFWHMISRYSSWSWIHIWIHIMNSYATFHDLWIHIWIHVYEEYREIIPEFMCTKVPDGRAPGRGSEGTGNCSSCYGWLSGSVWSIANLKSQMSWNRGLLQVQNIEFKKKMYLGVCNHSCRCVCPWATRKCVVGHATERLDSEYSWIHLRSFGN